VGKFNSLVSGEQAHGNYWCKVLFLSPVITGNKTSVFIFTCLTFTPDSQLIQNSWKQEIFMTPLKPQHISLATSFLFTLCTFQSPRDGFQSLQGLVPHNSLAYANQ
jgi:hypothetical protein